MQNLTMRLSNIFIDSITWIRLMVGCMAPHVRLLMWSVHCAVKTGVCLALTVQPRAELTACLHLSSWGNVCSKLHDCSQVGALHRRTCPVAQTEGFIQT